jgi:hypothetical protein
VEGRGGVFWKALIRITSLAGRYVEECAYGSGMKVLDAEWEVR